MLIQRCENHKMALTHWWCAKSLCLGHIRCCRCKILWSTMCRWDFCKPYYSFTGRRRNLHKCYGSLHKNHNAGLSHCPEFDRRWTHGLTLPQSWEVVIKTLWTRGKPPVAFLLRRQQQWESSWNLWLSIKLPKIMPCFILVCPLETNFGTVWEQCGNIAIQWLYGSPKVT